MHLFVKLYESSNFAGKLASGNRIPLLEFIRERKEKGEIPQWLKKLHRPEEADSSLGKFAMGCKMEGEQIVGACSPGQI